MPDSSSLQREVEAETTRLFPDAVRRVEWLGYGDSPLIEPGEIMPTFVLAEPRRSRGQRSGPRDTLTAFQHEHGAALKQFRLELARRWPEIRHIGVSFEDDRGRQRGGMIQALDDEHGPDHHGIPVTVRLEAAELETADGLITAGVAASRAEALRWALSRVREAGLQLPAVPRGQDDLGHQVGAQAELLRDLFRPPSLLVVEQRQFLLRLGPRPRDVTRRRPRLYWPGPVSGPGRDCGPGRAVGRGGRHGGAERAAPLIAILAAGQLVPGLLVKEQVLLG
jgi:hypothetical protein